LWHWSCLCPAGCHPWCADGCALVLLLPLLVSFLLLLLVASWDDGRLLWLTRRLIRWL